MTTLDVGIREIGVDESQRREFYDIMLADADRLHHTVDQVLKAGVVREKPTVARAPVDLGSLVKECVAAK